MLGGERTASVGMTAVEIDNILATPELAELVEAAEQTGSLRYADLAEVLELLHLDALETDAVYRGLEQKGLEIVEPQQEPPAPPPPPQPVAHETTTDALQLFLRDAGRHPLLTAAQEVELAKRIERGDAQANLPIAQAHEVKAAARASTSLDQPVGDTEDAVFGDFVAGEGPLPDEQVEVSLRCQALAEALAALSERERKVLILRYGLDDSEPKTLEEIGRRLGLTRERVRQIETEALKRLARLREMESVARS